MFSYEIDRIFKNTFFYRTPLVTASEIKKVSNFQGFLLWLISILFETCGFTNNPNFIRFKWKLKKKHSLAKSVIYATEIRWMEIRLKAFLLLLCRTRLFVSPRCCCYFPSYVRLCTLFPCYPATKGMTSKSVLLFSLNWKRRLDLNTLDL